MKVVLGIIDQVSAQGTKTLFSCISNGSSYWSLIPRPLSLRRVWVQDQLYIEPFLWATRQPSSILMEVWSEPTFEMRFPAASVP